jgi:uncharacterized membrane protein YkvA (DUF1232 family)
MSRIAALREWARRVERDVVAVYFAARDPATPLPVRVLAIAVAAYALSPLDLIPDFIPVVGYLDDVLIVPLGLLLVIRLLPPPVLAAARRRAEVALERPRSAGAAVAVAVIWVIGAGVLLYGVLHR